MKGGDDSRAGKAFGMGNPPRLTEESGVDPWIADLVRSTGPYKSPPGRKQRVLLSLGRSNTPRRAPLFLRPAIVAGVLIGCGAFASAAIGPWRGWIERAYERLVPTAAPVAVTAERARTHLLVSGHAATVAAQPLAVATSPANRPLLDVGPPEAPLPSRAPLAPPHLRRETPPPAAREEARREETKREVGRDRDREREKEEQETQSVLAGMRALRVDHDPVRARELLARYLERHPNGALAEEALALTIEAAVAHRDDDAPTLGARYLRRYPGGPFKELASRTQR